MTDEREVVFEDENGLRVAEGKVDRVSGNVNSTTQSATVFCKVNELMDGEMRDGRYEIWDDLTTPQT